MSYNLLKGKRGIIFGALNEKSIAWKVAEKAVEEGATITLSNTPVAVRMGTVSALSEKLHCEVIPADATNVEDLENVFKRSMEILVVRSTSFCTLSVCLPTFVSTAHMMTWTTSCLTLHSIYLLFHSTR